jgi:cation diffusion facilitator family transporter
MSVDPRAATPSFHEHVFLGVDHVQSERKTWAVIGLCGVMMCIEIVGGILFGSIALVADGLHMSTHAGALLLASLAYTYARRHAANANFTFGTGKFGDLAGFTSAVVLALIAILIGYESVTRILAPVQIHFAEAIPIACVGLAVNIASAWLLSRGSHHHGHSAEEPGHHHVHSGEEQGHHHVHSGEEQGHHQHHGATERDNNMRAAIVHVMADAAVSVLVIVGLLLARAFGWLWMDPLAGIIGACVIASWSYGLIRDTGAILLDKIPDSRLAQSLRTTIESDGSTLADLHLWRLGPGHLGAIVSVCPKDAHNADYYRAKLARYPALSHVTIEIQK